MKRRFVSLAIILFHFFLQYTFASPEEYRLIQDLRQNYDPFVRPVRDSSLPLNVTVRLYLNQILDVDEKNQVMSVLAYVNYTWTDSKLRWDPREYGGIEDIRFPGKDAKLWKPDILLFNSVSKSFDSTFACNFHVHYTGTVMQNPPGIMKFSCDIDVTWFPFDDQACFLKFGTWTHNGLQINLDMDVSNLEYSSIAYDASRAGVYTVDNSIDLRYYSVNGEWILLGTPGKRNVQGFGGDIYHELFYYVRIRRRTLSYSLNLIIPSLIISVMTVLGFTLPPNACEKITLETTILLSVIFFLQMVASMSPPTADVVPILSAFFSCCLLVVSASVVFTVLVLNLHARNKQTHEMSQFGIIRLEKLFDVRLFKSRVNPSVTYFREMRTVLLHFLPYILMMKRPQRRPPPPTPAPSIDDLIRPSRTPRALKRQDSWDSAKIHKSSAGFLKSMIESDVIIGDEKHFDLKDRYLCEIRRLLQGACFDLREIFADVLSFSNRIRDEYEEEMLIADWRFAAMTVDRLCLFLFSAFIVASTCTIMLSAPHRYA